LFLLINQEASTDLNAALCMTLQDRLPQKFLAPMRIQY
jgi:hypothetical protein